ncbi:hypothetical protein GOODEAATRI_006635, partial [Goodea atripinnis]
PDSSLSPSSSHLWMSYRQSGILLKPISPSIASSCPDSNSTPTPCSVVLFLTSHHVCGVGTGSLPKGWD